MRTITSRDTMRYARAKWIRAYANHDPARVPWRFKKSVGEILIALNALNIENCTLAEFDAAMGCSGWALNECDECGEHHEVLVRFGDEPDYEARWSDLCAGCLQEAIQKIAEAA